jgi:rare lipoprotein A
MRAPLKIAIVIGLPWMGLHAEPAAAQTFDERWPIIPFDERSPIIPKANAAPSPQVDEQIKTEPDEQPQSPIGAQPTSRSSKRVFFGKASYYSYEPRKTASGSSFDRNALTAAHRSLPFGTRVRVSDLTTSNSVVVVITDRGPNVPGRVLDLSLGAALTLGITKRGVVPVRAEVL